VLKIKSEKIVTEALKIDTKTGLVKGHDASIKEQ
jgi:hypothetical protein